MIFVESLICPQYDCEELREQDFKLENLILVVNHSAGFIFRKTSTNQDLKLCWLASLGEFCDHKKSGFPSIDCY